MIQSQKRVVITTWESPQSRVTFSAFGINAARLENRACLPTLQKKIRQSERKFGSKIKCCLPLHDHKYSIGDIRVSTGLWVKMLRAVRNACCRQSYAHNNVSYWGVLLIYFWHIMGLESGNHRAQEAGWKIALVVQRDVQPAIIHPPWLVYWDRNGNYKSMRILTHVTVGKFAKSLEVGKVCLTGFQYSTSESRN